MDAKEKIPIHKQMKLDYLRYALKTIKGRALPALEDNLKPVQRRVLFAANKVSRNFTKSSKLVGHVLGNYHPHGDQSVYRTICSLVQTFNMNYPLLTGQGNFGSRDGDNPAAQRYTEVKLSDFAKDVCFEELDSVPYKENYDGTRKEPVFLPVKLPLALLNGVQGTATGYRTSIPPHNLNELVDLLIKVIEKDYVTDKQIKDSVKGPDFPTGGIIKNSKKNISKGLLKGRGSVIIYPEYKTGEASYGRKKIIITEIPYKSNKARLVKKIADAVNNGRIGGISDLIDESDRDGIRISIVTKKRVSKPEEIMEELIDKSIGRISYRFNYSPIFVDGNEPVRLNIRDIASRFIEFRRKILRKHLNLRMENIDDEIDKAKAQLKYIKNYKKFSKKIIEADSIDKIYNSLTQYSLTHDQIDHILDTKITQTKKGGKEIEEKLDKLIKKKKRTKDNIENVDGLIIKQLEDLEDKYGRKRRTKIK